MVTAQRGEGTCAARVLALLPPAPAVVGGETVDVVGLSFQDTGRAGLLLCLVNVTSAKGSILESSQGVWTSETGVDCVLPFPGPDSLPAIFRVLPLALSTTITISLDGGVTNAIGSVSVPLTVQGSLSGASLSPSAYSFQDQGPPLVVNITLPPTWSVEGQCYCLFVDRSTHFNESTLLTNMKCAFPLGMSGVNIDLSIGGLMIGTITRMGPLPSSWLHADRGTIMGSGDDVVEWHDAANGKVFVGSGTLIASNMSNQPAIEIFEGDGYQLNQGKSQPFTIYEVVRSGEFGYFWDCGVPSSPRVYSRDLSDPHKIDLNAGANYQTTLPFDTMIHHTIVSWVIDGANSRVRIQGGAWDSGEISIGSNGISGFTVGNRYSLTNGLDGQIGAFEVWDGADDLATLRAREVALARQYGVMMASTTPLSLGNDPVQIDLEVVDWTSPPVCNCTFVTAIGEFLGSTVVSWITNTRAACPLPSSAPIEAYIGLCGHNVGHAVLPMPVHSNCRLTLNADSAIRDGGTGRATSWSDVSSCSSVSLSLSSTAPKVSLDQINTHSSVLFSYNEYARWNTISPPLNDATIIWVASMAPSGMSDGSPDGTIRKYLIDGGSSSPRFYIISDNANHITAHRTTEAAFPPTPFSVEEWHIGVLTSSGSLATLYQNGQEVGTIEIGQTAQTALTIGQYYPGTQNYNLGHLAFLQVYDKVLSDPERVEIEEWLSGYYGI